MNEMGNRIREARLKQGLTLEDVGTYVGVGKSTVRKWEQGTIQNMRRDKIKSLSEILHVSIEYLLNIPEAEETAGGIGSLSDYEIEVIKMLRSLSDDQKQAFLLFLKSLLSTQAP